MENNQAFTEASATLNNVLLYALCAKVFTEDELAYITSVWKTNCLPIFGNLIGMDEAAEVMTKIESSVTELIKITKRKKS
jgi:hypothetical protein